MYDLYETNGVRSPYVPLQHAVQQTKALENHVIILYFNEDAVFFAARELQEPKQTYVCLSLVLIILSIIGFGLAPGTDGGIYILIAASIAVVIAIGLIIFSVIQYNNTRKNRIDSSQSYSYYAYDISDQSIKLCIINKETKQETISNDIKDNKNVPSIMNWGYIGDIRGIRYNDNASQESFIQLKLKQHHKKNSKSKDDDDIMRDMLTFKFERQEFAQIMSERIQIIKETGLNNIQLMYQMQLQEQIGQV